MHDLYLIILKKLFLDDYTVILAVDKATGDIISYRNNELWFYQGNLHAGQWKTNEIKTLKHPALNSHQKWIAIL